MTRRRRRARHAHVGGRRAVVQRADRHVGAQLRRASCSGSSRISATRTSQCIAPQVIHDDYFWDGYFTGGAFQLALTLGAAALWDSAMALITGPSAADLVLNERVLRHLPLIDLDEVTIGRKVDYWRALVGAPDERRVLAAVPAPARDASTCRSSSRAAGSTRTRARTCARSPAIGDRRAEPRADGAVVARGGGRDLPGRRRPRAGVGDGDPRPRARVLRPLPQGRADNGWDDRPPLELFVLGANEWRAEQRVAARAAPSSRRGTCTRAAGRTRSRGDGTLGLDPPASGEPADRYAYDPEDPVPTIGGNNSVLTMTQGAADADPARARATSACSSAATTCSVTRATSSTATSR